MASQLPAETWLVIFELLDKTDWLRVNLVSKAFNASCLPLIYRDVDLSTHHSGVLHPLFAHMRDIEEPYDVMLEKQAGLYKVQARFLDTLLQHRDYADLVDSLTWTLTFGPEPAIPDESGGQIECPHNQTWMVLSAFVNVRRVDFAAEHLFMRESYARNSPEGLFRSAHSIRLSGLMGQNLVTSIVGHDYGRLQDLTIDDVQHWGLRANGQPLTDVGGSLKSQRDDDPGMYPLGPMRRMFGPGEQYCKLTSLFLRKVGQDRWPDNEWVEEEDIAVYKEWTTLIAALKHQLQHLTIEQACDTADRPSRCRTGHQIDRPMDRRFREHLLPIFLHGGWDKLQTLNIRGVGHWLGNPAFDDKSPESVIANAVGADVVVHLAGKPDRPAWLCRPPLI